MGKAVIVAFSVLGFIVFSFVKFAARGAICGYGSVARCTT